MLSRGAVAQLGERRVRNAKVEGSIPFRSTINSGVFGGPLQDAELLCRYPCLSRCPARACRIRPLRALAPPFDVSGRGFDGSLSHLNVILKGWVNEISNDVECVGASRLQCLFA